ncbi:MAG: ACP S-malonyltransferase [Anaerolineae bacterium]|nr:ACP S-malonyltransferase [Anaerolineae bacterium]
MPGYAVLFPGQGSQFVGMGRDLYDASAAARAIFDEADNLWQGELTRLVFEGPAEQLTDTVNAQPALYVTSLACWAALQEALAGPADAPAVAAGHSVGEYAALAIAGAFSFSTGFGLVSERGRAMKAAGDGDPGGMAAILGLDLETVSDICREATAQTGQVVVVANDNAPGQVVISGSPEGARVAGELARARGARRVVPLAVSIAAHSPLMEPAATRFREALHRADLHPPRIPVIANRDARPLDSAEAVAAELEAQLISPVRWTSSIQYIIDQGISTFIEVGPKDVLTGLVRRIAPEATCIPCGDLAGVRQAADAIRQMPHS